MKIVTTEQSRHREKGEVSNVLMIRTESGKLAIGPGGGGTIMLGSKDKKSGSKCTLAATPEKAREIAVALTATADEIEGAKGGSS